VGLSIGLTRLYDQLQDCGLLQPVPNSVQILVTQFDQAQQAAYLALATDLRRAGYRVENYLEPAKLEKQLKYADKTGIPLAIIMGPDEAAKGTVLVKNLARKAQHEVARSELIAQLPGLLAL
jgi:histidyl-tRNA synthetase